MTDAPHPLAQEIYDQLIPGDKCTCAAIDFNHWPSDLEKACGYCRDVGVITKALAQARRETLLEVAEAWDRMDHAELAKSFPSMDLYPKWGNIFAAWCRQQAQENP